MNPCVKIIVTLIDPTERLISFFAHALARNKSDYFEGSYTSNFQEFYINKTTGQIIQQRRGLSAGQYFNRLKRWFEFFPYENIHIVDGQRLKSHPWEEIQLLERFLGVQEITTESSFMYNTTRKFYCHKLIGCLVAGKGRRHPDVPDSAKEKLREYYQPHNVKLLQFLRKLQILRSDSNYHRFEWLQ